MKNENKYISIENTLKNVLNSRLNNHAVSTFKICLVEFKSIGFFISKEYLKNLIETNNKKSKSNFISKLVKRAELQSTPQNRYYKEHTGLSTIKTKQVFNMLLI